MKLLVTLYWGMFLNLGLFCQTEVPLFQIKYNRSLSSTYINENKELIPSLESSLSQLALEGAYGVKLNYRTEISGAINYQKVKISTKHIADSLPQNSLTSFYKTPSHSNLLFNINLRTDLKKEWSWANSVNLSITDDFFKKELKTNLMGGIASFVEKKKSEKFKFGFGVFMNQFKGRLFFSPLLSLAIKGKKRGLELVFPERLRVWQKIKPNSYISLEVRFLSNSLIHQTNNSIVGETRTSISAFQSLLKYNVIFQENIRLDINLGLPFRSYTLNNEVEVKTIYQEEGWYIGFGLSFVVDD